MKRRMSAALVSAALMFSLLTTASLAAGTTLTVKTPSTIPKAGEEFTVTVDIAGNPGFASAQFTLTFDKSDMVCTVEDGVLHGGLLSEMLNVVNPNVQGGAIIVAASETAKRGDGVLAELTFRANRDLSGFDFALTDMEFWDADGNTLAVGADTQAKPATSTTPKTPSGGTAEAAKATFPDAVGHWGEPWIVKAAERGLFSGDEKGNFLPDRNITRGDFVLVLWRMAGKPEPSGAAPFADVPGNAYYAKAVAWAYEKGCVNGKGSGFAPKDSLTRQEAMKILFGYAGSPSGMEVMLGGVYDSSFSDSGEIAPWAKPAMYWAVYNKIINGMNGGLNPKGEATRAQLAKILVEYQNGFVTTNSQ